MNHRITPSTLGNTESLVRNATLQILTAAPHKPGLYSDISRTVDIRFIFQSAINDVLQDARYCDIGN
jgi:hypothetical protein